MAISLRQHIEESDIAAVRNAAAAIPQHLLELPVSDYQPFHYQELQRALDAYARSISFLGRLSVCKDINQHLDAFFGSSFERSKPCRLEKIFDSNEIDILLLKLLHGRNQDKLYDFSQADRAEQLGTSINAIQTRIHALEDGKEILGHQVQVRTGGRGRVAYDDTIHPVFLTLNMKEVYFLTIALQQLSQGTPFARLAQGLSNDIYTQLSDYAKSFIDNHAAEKAITLSSSDPMQPIHYRTEVHDLLYYLKSGQRCTMRLLNGNSFTGTVKDDGSCFYLESADGVRTIFPEDSSLYELTNA